MLPWLTSVRHSSTRLSANLPTRAQTVLCHLSSSGIGAQQLPNRNLAHKLGNVENSGDSDCVILTNTEPPVYKMSTDCNLFLSRSLSSFCSAFDAVPSFGG